MAKILYKDRVGCDGMVYEPYLKSNPTYLRPYIPGENLSGISVAECDVPAVGGMIAQNPDEIHDRWYVSKEYFEKNYTKANK